MKEKIEVVYIIEAIGLGLFKIGFTRDIKSRLEVLQYGCPAQLVLRALISSGSNSLEHSLHSHFGEFSHHGEWFNLPRDWKELLPKNLVICFPNILSVQTSSCKCVRQTSRKVARKERLKKFQAKISKLDFSLPEFVSLTPEQEARMSSDEAKRHEAYSTTWVEVMAQINGSNLPLQRVDNKELVH